MQLEVDSDPCNGQHTHTWGIFCADGGTPCLKLTDAVIATDKLRIWPVVAATKFVDTVVLTSVPLDVHTWYDWPKVRTAVYNLVVLGRLVLLRGVIVGALVGWLDRVCLKM